MSASSAQIESEPEEGSPAPEDWPDLIG